jgi:hypothetical protein
MKLFTKDIDKKLFQQYQNGSDLDSQVAVAKIFNPYGNGRWFLLNSDPQDPDYLWAIVQMGDIVEVGSVLRSELESVRVSPFKLPLERDLGFTMKNASEVYRGLQEGKFYNKGGSLMAAKGMEVGRYYKDKNGDSYRYIGENSQRQTLFNDGQKIIVKSIDDFDDEPKNKKLFGIFENGGMVSLNKHYKTLGKKDDLVGLKVYDKNNDEFVYIKNVDSGIFAGKNKKDDLGHNYSMSDLMVEKMENGGEMDDQGVDLFEDYENTPHNVQVILVKYTDVFEDGSYNGLAKAKKELEQIGYTFEYGLGGGAYDLRRIGQKGKNEDDYADGGFVDKTDEELKDLSDDELFEYLDAKAAYMKQYAKPLSSFKAKNYAANSAAVQFQNEGTSKLDANFPSLSKINEQATKDYQETISKKSDKMAKGGMSEHGLKVGDKIVADEFWDKKIIVENSKTKKRAEVDLEKGKRKEEMAMGGKVKFQDKVKAIKASLLKTKKVPKKVQKDYGKTYNAKEAELAAKRIAGSMAKKGMK